MTDMLVQVTALKKTFDLSRPLINLILDRSGRQFVHAVDGVDFSIT